MLCLQRQYNKTILFNQTGECAYGNIKFWKLAYLLLDGNLNQADLADINGVFKAGQQIVNVGM